MTPKIGMTAQEAIKLIKDCGLNIEQPLHDMVAACIITVLEKQIQKKPDYEGDGYDDNGEIIFDTAYCPCCRHEFEVCYDITNYCPVCGQALDWSDRE